MKAGLIAVVLLLFSTFLDAQDITADVVHSGKLEPLAKLIYIDQLSSATAEDLRLLRNTIYAKYGLIFRSNELKTHFKQFLWYRELLQSVEEKLNYIDQANIQLIQRLEKAASNIDEKSLELVGLWHFFPIMPDAPGDYICVYPNGIFQYVFNTGMKAYGSAGFSGIWQVRDRTLTLTAITEKAFLYDEIKVMKFENDEYKGVKEGHKYIIPERVETNTDFQINKKLIIPDELERDYFEAYGAKWYRFSRSPFDRL